MPAIPNSSPICRSTMPNGWSRPCLPMIPASPMTTRASRSSRRWWRRAFPAASPVTSHREAEADRLTSAGADLVLEPFQDAADRAVDLLGGDQEPERIAFEGMDEATTARV